MYALNIFASNGLALEFLQNRIGSYLASSTKNHDRSALIRLFPQAVWGAGVSRPFDRNVNLLAF